MPENGVNNGTCHCYNGTVEIKQSESSVIFTSRLTIFDTELLNKNDIIHYSEPADTTLSENTKYRILQRKE